MTSQALLISLARRINEATGLHLSRDANQTGNFVLRPADIVTLAGLVGMAQDFDTAAAMVLASHKQYGNGPSEQHYREAWERLHSSDSTPTAKTGRAGVDWSAAGRKSWATRRANEAKAKKRGQPPACTLTPRGYTRDPSYSGLRGRAGA